MENFKSIIKNKFFWINYFSLFIFYLTTNPQMELILEGIKKIIKRESIAHSLLVSSGFLSISVAIVFLDLMWLYPVNWFFNKFAEAKNGIFLRYSFLILFPHVVIYYLKTNFDIDVMECALFSSVILMVIFMIQRRKKLRSFSTWGLATICGVLSALLFTLLTTTQILSLALFAAKLKKIKDFIFLF